MRVPKSLKGDKYLDRKTVIAIIFGKYRVVGVVHLSQNSPEPKENINFFVNNI